MRIFILDRKQEPKNVVQLQIEFRERQDNDNDTRDDQNNIRVWAQNI